MIFKILHSAPACYFCLARLLQKPILIPGEIRLHTQGSASNMHVTERPCWSACLSSGELARGSLGSSAVVIVKYNLIQICNHMFKALPCSPERSTGWRQVCSALWMGSQAQQAAAMASWAHTVRALPKGGEDPTLRAVEAAQPQAMCLWLQIWSELLSSVWQRSTCTTSGTVPAFLLPLQGCF